MDEQVLPLSLDWLAISIRLTSPVREAPAGFVWARYAQTNVWSCRWCLYNSFGDKVFTLLFHPRQSIIAKDAALLEVANEWLYHGLGVSGVMALLGEVCGYVISGVSRVDFAVDFTPTEAQRDVIIGLDQRTMRVAGKRNGNNWWSMTSPSSALHSMWTGFCPHDMNWGHKTSDVKWKLYYKSKELRDGAGGHGWSKPYIVDMWREVGLEEANVWRLEVSLKHCNNFDYCGDALSYFAIIKEPIRIFKSLYTSRFQVQQNEGHKDRSNDKIVPFLPVGAMRKAFKVRRSKVLVEHDGCIGLMRHLVADVETERVLMNEPVREAIFYTLDRVIEVNQMEEYFVLMKGQRYEDWKEEMRVKAYYFDEGVRMEVGDREQTMEQALYDAGLINLDCDPLGAPSSTSHAEGIQQSLFGD